MRKGIENNCLVRPSHGRVSFTNPVSECLNMDAPMTGTAPTVTLTADDLISKVYKQDAEAAATAKRLLDDPDVAGYKLVLVDEVVRMDPVLFNELFCGLDPVLPYQENILSVLGLNLSVAYDNTHSAPPIIKNEIHRNDPWRRKQWKSR